MATHSNILAWKITRTEEPGRLQSMVSQRTGHRTEHSRTAHWIQMENSHHVFFTTVVKTSQMKIKERM